MGNKIENVMVFEEIQYFVFLKQYADIVEKHGIKYAVKTPWKPKSASSQEHASNRKYYDDSCFDNFVFADSIQEHINQAHQEQ